MEASEVSGAAAPQRAEWCHTRAWGEFRRHARRNSPRDGALVSTDVAAPDRVTDLTAKAEAAGITIDIWQAPHSGEFADLLARVSALVMAG